MTTGFAATSATNSEEAALFGALLDEARAQDEALERHGLEIWLGSEPTFTRRDSQAPAWRHEALGDDKQARARDLARELAPRLSEHALVTHAQGRLYDGEGSPRFSYGLAWRRDGQPLSPWTSAPLGLMESPAPPPHTHPELAWLTVTPDPGVVEVNHAPSPTLHDFARQALAIDEAACAVGLSAVRWLYNGDVTDSGGGGQLTLGGPTPERSPFFLHPRLLPSLVRFFQRHPALSYFFAMECVGSAGQGPRVDEGARERFDELPIALDWMERLAARGALDATALWQTLAPLLVDAAGNAHRAELNVEKLWNPELRGRGRLGLVELRSLRMEPTPSRRVAVALLMRALAAHFARHPYGAPVVEHGAALHDRFALPTVLQRDLDAALTTLDEGPFALGVTARALLRALPEPRVRATLGDATLTLTPAREFWPLVGDVASQERAGARLVDSSTSRWELRVDAPRNTSPGALYAGGFALPLRPCAHEQADPRGATTWVCGVRARVFAPSPGFHPGLPASDPWSFVWAREGEALELTVHGWRPEGGGYDGLPLTDAEAHARRAARILIRPLPPDACAALSSARPFTVEPSQYTVDLRRLAS